MSQELRAEVKEGSQPAAIVPDTPHVPPVTPTSIIETTFDFARSCILLAAVELDLFTWIARGVSSLGTLTERAAVDEPALARLLGALCAMDFLQHTERGYALTPVAERFLV